jgi:hypothetical protein
METKTAATRMQGLLSLFDLQTTFFERALDGISEEHMYSRLNTKANHMAWLAGSLVAQRYLMASEIRPDLKQTKAELFQDFKGIQDEAKYPTITEYLEDWKKVSPFARLAIQDMDDQKLDSELDMGGMKMSWNDLMSFTIYREASMIGQLTLWRRLLNYPAFRYD